MVLPPPGNKAAETKGASAPSPVMFFERAHDEFLNKLHDDFMERYGVDICNIRIESFKIMDDELSDQISKHALTTAQIENEMANLEGKVRTSGCNCLSASAVSIVSRLVCTLCNPI